MNNSLLFDLDKTMSKSKVTTHAVAVQNITYPKRGKRTLTITIVTLSNSLQS